METDVDAYFAQNDVPSFVSDMLFELGFHRPKDVGNFIAGYVDRRFRLEGQGGNSNAGPANRVAGGQPAIEDFTTLEVHTAPASMSSEEELACALLAEARSLRAKYSEFDLFCEKDKSKKGDAAVGGEEFNDDAVTMAVLSWNEFRTDYERMLLIFTSPVLWSFCERRLKQLRGLFVAHCALNWSAEEAEALAETPTRVDGCIQITRCLPPNRCMDLFRELQTDGDDAEVAAGVAFNDLVDRHGRTVTPADIGADPDAPAPADASLCGVFSKINDYSMGRFLADVAKKSFDLLERTSALTGGESYAEYRLPLLAETGAWAQLAGWAVKFGLLKHSRAKWVVQIAETAYGSLKERRAVLSFGELLENVFVPPASAAVHFPSETSDNALAQFMRDVVAIEIAAIPGNREALNLEDNKDPREWIAASSPPFAYQSYHVWARLKALNRCRKAGKIPPLALVGSCATAEPLAAMYLLGSRSVSRCSALASHAPLQYLFHLDGVSAQVSLTSKRSLATKDGTGLLSFQKLFEAGVPVTLCTEDPSVNNWYGDNLLEGEYSFAANGLGLSLADLAELSKNSVVASGWSAEGHDATLRGADTKASVRERYRLGRRGAEVALVERLAPRALLPHALNFNADK